MVHVLPFQKMLLNFFLLIWDVLAMDLSVPSARYPSAQRMVTVLTIITTGLVNAAKKDSIDYAVDIYPFYGSDADAALSAGKDARHGLIGAGVYASHGYERSHKDGVVNTFRLLCSYLNGNAPKMD